MSESIYLRAILLQGSPLRGRPFGGSNHPMHVGSASTLANRQPQFRSVGRPTILCHAVATVSQPGNGTITLCAQGVVLINDLNAQHPSWKRRHKQTTSHTYTCLTCTMRRTRLPRLPMAVRQVNNLSSDFHLSLLITGLLSVWYINYRIRPEFSTRVQASSSDKDL